MQKGENHDVLLPVNGRHEDIMRDSIVASTNHPLGSTDMERPRTQLPSQQEFSGAVDSRFDIARADSGSAEFTLIECQSLLSNEHQECYSLVFRGPADVPPVQNIYVLQHDKLGTLELFLVPIKKDDRGLYFEAVINHLSSN